MGRPMRIDDSEGNTVNYTYDGDGNRVLELSYDTELKGNLNSKEFTTVNAAEAALEENLGDEERGLYEITRYINDVNREYTQVLMERDGSGVLSTAYVYGNERLSVRSTKKESGYYLYDGRGSVTGIVSILGERLESYSYDPSGQAMRATSTNRYQKTFYGYNAESYDPKTGSVYLRARYYNTRTGSFSTKDTYLGDLMEPLSLNRYSYTWGNPVNYQDPSGHGPFGSDSSIKNGWFIEDGMNVFYKDGKKMLSAKYITKEIKEAVEKNASSGCDLVTLDIEKMYDRLLRDKIFELKHAFIQEFIEFFAKGLAPSAGLAIVQKYVNAIAEIMGIPFEIDVGFIKANDREFGKTYYPDEDRPTRLAFNKNFFLSEPETPFDRDTDYLFSTIVHEMRHVYQYWNWKMDGEGLVTDETKQLWESTRENRYYNYKIIERDATFFSGSNNLNWYDSEHPYTPESETYVERYANADNYWEN